MAPSLLAAVMKEEEEGEDGYSLETTSSNNHADGAHPAQLHSELTTVNGIGMWNQWTRNFKSPLLALLDLLDNAFDASTTAQNNFPGQIYVGHDTSAEDGLAESGQIVILNNSSRFIKPMAQVLSIYTSSKASTESIGENGVGLKQGCATLSDLSFCLAKNRGQYSFGIICRDLQQAEGCSLPSFVFPMLPTAEEMENKFDTHMAAGECVRQYGSGCRATGVARLLSHFSKMHEMDHGFCVVLTKLRHGGQTLEQEDTAAAQSLLTSLKQALPRQYIHVPSALRVHVDGEPINFTYWQQRLVELTVYYIKVDPQHPVLEADDWKDPVEGYSLRVFAGFDPLRLQTAAKSPLSLLIYSRRSGRLIKYAEDGRVLLKLNASGTQYCQGLTILVDDYQGKLPLSPTKQDLAFGEQAHGETHELNLYKWLTAITKSYYDFHLAKVEKKKGTLTEEVKRHATHLFSRTVLEKPLPDCQLTKFENFSWHGHAGHIRCNKKTLRQVEGQDTLYRIKAPRAATVERVRQKTTPKKPQPRAQPPEGEAMNGIAHRTVLELDQLVARHPSRNDSENDGSSLTRIPRKRKSMEPAEDQNAKRRAIVNADAAEEAKAEVNRLKEENARLVHVKSKMRETLRSTLQQNTQLHQENARLKRTVESNSRRTQEATLAAQDELAHVKARNQQLEEDLRQSQEQEQVARNETELQMEVANHLRRKWAELKRQMQLSQTP